MADRFPYGSIEPAGGAYVVTPSDSVDLPERVRGITIGTAAGAISYVGWDGATYTTGPLPIGTHGLYAKRIRATGTTATGLTAWSAASPPTHQKPIPHL